MPLLQLDRNPSLLSILQLGESPVVGALRVGRMRRGARRRVWRCIVVVVVGELVGRIELRGLELEFDVEWRRWKVLLSVGAGEWGIKEEGGGFIYPSPSPSSSPARWLRR